MARPDHPQALQTNLIIIQSFLNDIYNDALCPAEMFLQVVHDLFGEVVLDFTGLKVEQVNTDKGFPGLV